MNGLYDISVELINLVNEVNAKIPDIKPFDIHTRVKEIPKFAALSRQNKSLYRGILQRNVNMQNIHVLKRMLKVQSSSSNDKNAEITEYLAKEHNVDWSKK